MHALYIIAFVALGITLVLLLLVLFEPPLRYRVEPPAVPLDSEDFLRVVSSLADSQLHRRGRVRLLADGKRFYEAELEAIAKASVSVHLEAFIFHPSPVGGRFLAALAERARAGVKVRVVVDYVGSFPAPDRYFRPLRDAGGDVRWYQPLRPATLKRLNNRTHRELIVVDGRVGFIGGAGIASHWDTGENGEVPWRDMVFRVEGDLARGLQTAFAENWLESSGQILAAVEDFPAADNAEAGDADGDAVPSTSATIGLVIVSSPTPGRSTRNRVLFQTLIAAARKSVYIHSPECHSVSVISPVFSVLSAARPGAWS